MPCGSRGIADLQRNMHGRFASFLEAGVTDGIEVLRLLRRLALLQHGRSNRCHFMWNDYTATVPKIEVAM